MKVTVKRKEPNFIPVVITSEFIKLEAALKFANAVSSGGIAKAVIQDELVRVNGEICTMRGKKLYDGDCFSYEGIDYKICNDASK
ncbi:MAG: RNA-binding S4 domain-containing protein [Oscillospiraceae bacterium]|nr:RNA-binding S4 domain-containing protein [Oscillospiraceae bacterium]